MAVLIVEDDDRVAALIGRLLLEEGYTTDAVGRATEATSLAFASRYRLIILDWNLPDVDGLSLLRSWRARGLSTPVLMISRATDYLAKPFLLSFMLSTIERLVRPPSPRTGTGT
ncbi:MAG: response regulator [Deltaproteobacteria bacterium]|nr:response regulator [Deltaproteobacteria bacterium]